MSAMGRDKVGEPVPGEGVQVRTCWLSETEMMPSFFLKAALLLGMAMTRRPRLGGVLAEVDGNAVVTFDGGAVVVWNLGR